MGVGRQIEQLFREPARVQQGLTKWLLAPERPGLGRAVGTLGARPDFLIIGTQKGGSTSLYRYLTAHPKVRSAAIKEIHYFSYYHACPESWYRAHFAPGFWLRARGLQTGEASMSHLHVPGAPERVAASAPGAKLIVMLRNPVARAFSHYQMSVKQGHETLPFAEAVALEPERLQRERDRLGDAAFSHGPSHRYHSYLLRGHYAEQLERWFAHFPREQFLILSSESFFRNPSETYHDVLGFLGLPEIDLPSYRQLNRAAEARPAFPPELRAQLEGYFAPYNARLEKLLEVLNLEVPTPPARVGRQTAPPTRAPHRPRARVLTDGTFGQRSPGERPPS